MLTRIIDTIIFYCILTKNISTIITTEPFKNKRNGFYK